MTLEANDNMDVLIDYEIRAGIKMQRLEADFFLDDLARADLKHGLGGTEKSELDDIIRIVSFLVGYKYGLACQAVTKK